MQSMTGYGSGECSVNGLRVAIQIKATNRKQIDIRMRLAKELAFLELDVRKILCKHINRGAIYLSADLIFEPGDEGRLEVDVPAARAIYDELRRLADDLGLDDKLKINDLLAIPNLRLLKQRQTSSTVLSETTLAAVHEAIEELRSTRSIEGVNLREALESHLDNVEALHGQISNALARNAPDNFEKACVRAREILTSAQGVDERVIKEVAQVVSSCDLAEELTRLTSHFGQMRNLFRHDETPGRKLDFLIQEVNREINTIGAKSNDIDITNNVVDLKTELEKIREQVQNIE